MARLPLPPQFEIIVVPAGRPQTKPRALNYALPFCRGELLTIYDAEDIPEPDQLRKAARRFAAAAPELACLQAQLTFFNPNENWLTRQFTAEYAMLFGRLLPVLADHRLPLPLGGTSNHFRTAVLRAVGGWDPFNVTEDADLGLRLARHGYDTGTLDSLTYEEANTRLPNWMRQRARWLKGFLATWLVHMRDPARLMREVGPAGFWVAQAVTIGVFASALLHPLCLVATLVLLSPSSRAAGTGRACRRRDCRGQPAGLHRGLCAGHRADAGCAAPARHLRLARNARHHAVLLAADVGCGVAGAVAVHHRALPLEQDGARPVALPGRAPHALAGWPGFRRLLRRGSG